MQVATVDDLVNLDIDDKLTGYVPWTNTSSVVIPGDLTVEGDTALAGLTAADTAITGTLDVTGAATLKSTLDVTGKATLKDALAVTSGLTAMGNKFAVITAYDEDTGDPMPGYVEFSVQKALVANTWSNTVTMGSIFEADLNSSTVRVYDEWTDG